MPLIFENLVSPCADLHCGPHSYQECALLPELRGQFLASCQNRTDVRGLQNHRFATKLKRQCAQGGIRTPVATRASDLQSDAFDRSATCAYSPAINFLKASPPL